MENRATDKELYTFCRSGRVLGKVCEGLELDLISELLKLTECWRRQTSNSPNLSEEGRILNWLWGSAGFLEGISSKRNMRDESELTEEWGQKNSGKGECRGEAPN